MRKRKLLENRYITYLVPFNKLFTILKCFWHFDRPKRYVCSSWWYHTSCIAWTTMLWICCCCGSCCCNYGGRWRWWWCFWWCLMLWWLLLCFCWKCWCCHFCIWISVSHFISLFIYLRLVMIWLHVFCILWKIQSRRLNPKQFVSFARPMQRNTYTHVFPWVDGQKSFCFLYSSNCNQTTSFRLRFVNSTRA